MLNLTTLLWAQWNMLVQLTVLSVVVLAALGLYDDYTKIMRPSSGGASARETLGQMRAYRCSSGLYLWQGPATKKLIMEIMVPFYKNASCQGCGADRAGG